MGVPRADRTAAADRRGLVTDRQSKIKAAAERLYALLDSREVVTVANTSRIMDGYRTMWAVIDAVERLDLAPDDCTTDVLRALWPIAEDEFPAIDVNARSDHWANELFEWVEELVNSCRFRGL